MSDHAPLPLFLLHTTLFPGQDLALKVFEVRYLDLIARCLRQNQPFGVCLISEGVEVGAAARPCRVGTVAAITRCAVPGSGIMRVEVRGASRFRIRRSAYDKKLALADVEPWDDAVSATLPAEFAGLGVLFQRLTDAPPTQAPDATGVGLGLAARVPVPAGVRQRWLEQRDPIERLRHIEQALTEFSHHHVS